MAKFIQSDNKVAGAKLKSIESSSVQELSQHCIMYQKSGDINKLTA